MKKILIRGLCLAAIILLISMVGMGIIDLLVFGIIAFAVLVLACLATIIRNQK